MVRRMEEDDFQIESILMRVVNHAKNFYQNIDARKVVVDVPVPIKSGLPKQGMGAIKAYEFFLQNYSEGLSASAGPRYLGFVTGGSTPAALAGDWLVSLYDQNVVMLGDSIAGFLEVETIDMLKELFFLGNDYSGTFLTGATMANFVGLAQARQWVGHQYKTDISQKGLYGIPAIKIAGGTMHSSIFKAAAMLGMGRENIHTIQAQSNREAIDINKLKDFLEENKDHPSIVVANSGTVNTVDFDNLTAINSLKDEYNFWLHVDAAFGGFAASSPKYNHFVRGLDKADSITIDAHKWLNVPYDSAMQFSRHRQLQIEVFQNNAAYLASAIDNPEFIHLTPENSRRFRALPSWFTLKAYGKEGYQEVIERNAEMAKCLGQKIEQSDDFKLLSPVKLNVVCFTLNKEEITTNLIDVFLKRLTKDGRVFMTATQYQGIPAIRAAFSNWRTNSEDTQIIWRAMNDVLKKSL
jgi:glutamate/tyrosine decarboxylase-like PLP-dependent enzyme